MSKPTCNATLPEHIFISFSQHDKAVAESIVHALRRKEIPVWIDYSRLTAGTPDWETAIRAAIDKSFAVVVLASPKSRASKYVRGELNVAESKGRQIYPLWIDGSEWSDCIPLGMTYAQFIDGRGKRLEKGIVELCNVLEQHIRTATPKHYLVSPLRREEGPEQNLSLTQVFPPPGFTSIEITKGGDRWRKGGKAVFIRTSDYSSIHGFLDDLYLNYLTDRFEPFTYGTKWVLEEKSPYSSGHILLPWSWLLKHQPSSEMESEWLHDTPLNECGLVSGTFWRLQTTTDVEPRGLAINDVRILQAIRRSPKAEYFLRGEGVLEDRPISEVGSDFRLRVVISSAQFFRRAVPPGTAVVQSNKVDREDFLKHWLP